MIESGTIAVDAVDDGIRGKDYIVIQGGTIDVEAGGDGLKSDNEEDEGMGYITIESGTIHVESGGDAITAQTEVAVVDGQIDMVAGGGSSATIGEDESAKGIKSASAIVIDGGDIQANCADDAIHSNDSIVINGGDFVIATGDDAVHGDSSVIINDGEFDIADCCEGIESAYITIDGGAFHIVSSDDALNVAGGNDGSGIRPGQDYPSGGNYFLLIEGGYFAINSGGDGLDANGSIEMNDGTVFVHGPTSRANGAIDYDGEFAMNGGLLVAVGASGMAQAPDYTSDQNSLLLTANTPYSGGTLIHIQNSAGTGILTFAPEKNYQSLAFSSPNLQTGTSYQVYTGGSSTGDMADGLYENGAYSGGSKIADLTVTSVVTTVNAGGGGWPH